MINCGRWQAQSGTLLQSIQDAYKRGRCRGFAVFCGFASAFARWLLIEHIHLVPNWLPQLDALLATILEAGECTKSALPMRPMPPALRHRMVRTSLTARRDRPCQASGFSSPCPPRRSPTRFQPPWSSSAQGAPAELKREAEAEHKKEEFPPFSPSVSEVRVAWELPRGSKALLQRAGAPPGPPQSRLFERQALLSGAAGFLTGAISKAKETKGAKDTPGEVEWRGDRSRIKEPLRTQ